MLKIMDWQKIWNDIVGFFQHNGWNIALFFVVLVFGIMAVKLFLNITRRILNKTKMEKIAVGFVMAILKFLLYLLLVIALLSIIGIEVSGIVTALSAVFLSVGLALQSTIANVANGIIIVSSKMFKKGDYIAVDGVEGSVTQINFLYITLITPDNKRITLPNNALLNGVVTNYDSNNTRRVNFSFEVGYDNDVEQVKKVVLDCMKSNGLVLLDPAPFCRLNELGGSNLVFTARCWCDREDYWTVYFDITETVFNEFKRHNISIAYDQIEIRERTDEPANPVNGDGLPVRKEKNRKKVKHFDLEDVDLGAIFTRKAKPSKAERKAAKRAAQADAKAADPADKTPTPAK